MTGDTLNRRDLVRLTAGGLAAAGLAAAVPGAAEREFSFLVVNDTHYLDEGCRPWLTAAFRQMREQPEEPEFCLLAGDLVENGTREPLAAIRGLLDTLAMPVYAVPGNHDYAPGDDRRAYDALFPGRLNYQFEHRGWRFLGLDTSDGVRYQNILVQPPTLAWLDETLPRLDRKQPLVVFTHFPLGAGVTYRPRNAAEVLERFAGHNLRAVFSGHFHGFTERTAGGAVLTTNRCCAFSRRNHDGTPEKGYFLCRARPDGGLARTFVKVGA